MVQKRKFRFPRRKRFKRKNKPIASYKGSHGYGDVIMYKSPNQKILPTEYVCKMINRVSMSWGVAANSPFTAAGVAGPYNISMNALAAIASSQFSGFTTAGITLLPGLSLTQAPGGFSRLCNANTYNQHLVIASRIKVSLAPQSLSDSIIVTCTPSNTASVPPNGGSAYDEPMTKMKVFRSSNEARGQLLTNYCDIGRFIGLERKVFESDPSLNWAGTASAHPAKTVWWVLNFQTADALQNSTPVAVDIEVESYVKLFSFTSANM